MRKYQELRWKSEFSLGVGTGKLEEHVDRAAALEMPALCLTEAGTLRHAFAAHEAAKKKGIRPIIGTEFIMVADHRRRALTPEEEATIEGGKRERRRAVARAERRLGLDREWLLTARAATAEGVQNLFRLSSRGWLEGLRRGRPRVDLDLLEEHVAGLVVTVGGADGLAEHLAQSTAAGVALLSRLREIFPDRLFLELHPHAGVHRAGNRAAVLLGQHLDIPRVAVNDVRYVLPTDTDAHTAALCLARRGMTLEDPRHPRSVAGYHLRDGDEVFDAFRNSHPDLSTSEIEEAIARTLEVADLCRGELTIDPHAALVPSLAKDPFAELVRLCREGWTWRDIPGRAKRRGVSHEGYARQLRHELETIRAAGKFSSYFLYVRDIIQWCRKSSIMVGPGRGSAAGALVCYLLGITSIDPLEHGLMFERFLAPGRVDTPDIDVDFDQARRGDVINYIRTKYGDDRVAMIATYGKMHGKGALKDVCRVLGMPFGPVNAVTATFPNNQGDEKIAVRRVLEGSETGREFMRNYPHVLELVDRLEGTIRQVGIHAAGVVASPVPISDVCPVEVHGSAGEETRVTALDMWGVGALGLVKMDVLGLANLTVLKSTQDAIRARHGKDIDFEELTFDDQPTIDAFTRQEFTGIFQFDASSARAVCADLTFGGFADVAALTALNRPGLTRSGLTDKFRARRQNEKEIEPVHPDYDEITADTLGIIVYQEQLIRLFRQLAGFTPEEADKMRKIVGKKLGADEMEKHRTHFLEGALARGMAEEVADGIFDAILKFASYAFNRAHACSYAAIAYWEQWAKVHYPQEFVWALMACAKDSDEALSYIPEARRLGVEILPPDISESGARWTLTGEKTIRAGLADVKGVGKAAVAAITAAQPFTDLVDFLTRVPGRAANRKVLDHLIRAGAMRSLLPNTRWALENLDEWHGVRGKKGWEASVRDAVTSSRSLPEYDAEDLLALALAVSPQGSGRHPLELHDSLFAAGGPLAVRSWTALDDPDLWSRSCAYLCGMVSSVKFRQVGDFGGESMSDDEKKRKQYGRRFAVIQLQNKDGVEVRVKVDPDALDRFGHVIERGPGNCVVIQAAVLGKFRSLRAVVCADLDDLRQKFRVGVPLSFWERTFTDNHPVLAYSRKSFLKKSGSQFTATGLITHVRETIDRNGNEMAFFGFQDGHGYGAEVVAFSSVWDTHKDAIVVGTIVDAELRADRRSVVLDEGGIVETRSRAPSNR